MKIKHLKNRVANTFAILFGILVFSSCVKNNDDFTPTTSFFSIVNGYSGNASVDFYIDNQKANANPLLYKQNTQYQEVYSGQRLLTVTQAGTTNVLVNGAVGFSPDNYYSVFLAKKTATSTDTVLGVVTIDSLTAPTSGSAKLRFANLNPGATKIDVFVQGTTDSLFSNRGFMDVSRFKNTGAGSRVLEIRQAGTTVTKSTITVNLEAGKIYTLSTYGLFTATAGADAFGAQLTLNK